MLYMGLACLVADGMSASRVFLNENGIMAIHAPLTAARSGSFSTRTASPRVILEFASLASIALDRDMTIDNTLVQFTKPEVAKLGIDLGVGDQLKKTVSCWQIGRTPEHCGRCVPCLVRE